jgi:hypothetical protein
MSLAWVGTVAAAAVGAMGVFFTWLTGKQARSHVAEMSAQSLKHAERQRVREERQEAYFAVLRLASVNAYREKYERRGDTAKLQEVNELWPRSERRRLVVEADIGLEVYGSDEARQLVQEWSALDDPHETDSYERFHERFLSVCRRDLGIDNLMPGLAIGQSGQNLAQEPSRPNPPLTAGS